MKIINSVLLGLALAVVGGSFAAAQQTPSTMPKILQIDREFIKPGKAGALHDASESRFVAAMTKAKWPTHYIALNSLSGRSRALYISAYASFAAWQKDMDATDKDAALSAELDRLSVSDGELLDGTDQFVLYYDGDLSYHPIPDLADVRYMEITTFHIHPGHRKDFSDLVKMVIAGQQKAGTHANWAMYEMEYGGGNEFVLFSADKSLSEIDESFTEGKKFDAAMGKEGITKLTGLVSSTIASSDSELFAINPRQSYAPPQWVKENPGFWEPKQAAKPATAKKHMP